MRSPRPTEESESDLEHESKRVCPSAPLFIPPPEHEHSVPFQISRASSLLLPSLLAAFKGMDLNGAHQEVSTVATSISGCWTVYV
jgi:hypothetical protein